MPLAGQIASSPMSWYRGKHPCRPTGKKTWWQLAMLEHGELRWEMERVQHMIHIFIVYIHTPWRIYMYGIYLPTFIIICLKPNVGKYTPLTFNIAPQNRKLIFQPSIFRGKLLNFGGGGYHRWIHHGICMVYYIHLHLWYIHLYIYHNFLKPNVGK